MSTRILGIICIVCSVIWAVDGLRWAAIGLDDFDTLASSANMIWAVGGMCAIIGMIRLNAVGTNVVVRALACRSSASSCS